MIVQCFIYGGASGCMSVYYQICFPMPQDRINTRGYLSRLLSVGIEILHNVLLLIIK